jgi:predicted membrane metal-binding protein
MPWSGSWSKGVPSTWTAPLEMSQLHYLPLAPGFFAILVGFFFIVLILRSVRYAYESLGVSSNTAIFLLLATLIGSFFNIPIAELAPERAMSHHHVDFFGMRYAVPGVSHWKGTVVAVNVGGAVIPTLMSIYLLIRRELCEIVAAACFPQDRLVRRHVRPRRGAQWNVVALSDRAAMSLRTGNSSRRVTSLQRSAASFRHQA